MVVSRIVHVAALKACTKPTSTCRLRLQRQPLTHVGCTAADLSALQRHCTRQPGGICIIIAAAAINGLLMPFASALVQWHIWPEHVSSVHLPRATMLVRSVLPPSRASQACRWPDITNVLGTCESGYGSSVLFTSQDAEEVWPPGEAWRS